MCGHRVALIAQLVRNAPAVQETLGRFLGREDPLEKGQAAPCSILGLPLWVSWQRFCLQCGRPGFNPWVGERPWRRERLPTPVSWSEESHGLCSSGGRKESATPERLSLHCVFLIVRLAMVSTMYEVRGSRSGVSDSLRPPGL